MMIVRPVRESDHNEILALADRAGIGMTSLPPDPDVLARKIARSVASFEATGEFAGREAFLLVLEDTDKKELVGTTGIVAHVGTRNPFYSYKLSTIVQASADLEVYSQHRVLHMVNDYTGVTEIGSLFLMADYRRDGIGKFLSRCRYLMLAEFGSLFSDVVISEIRGVQDEQGQSPFYKNLAQHFFKMEFKKADFVHATQGGQFISDLMPRYPIYVNLLSPQAQEVIVSTVAPPRCSVRPASTRDSVASVTRDRNEPVALS
jgi:arginine N-succinyltransferase